MRKLILILAILALTVATCFSFGDKWGGKNFGADNFGASKWGSGGESTPAIILNSGGYLRLNDDGKVLINE